MCLLSVLSSCERGFSIRKEDSRRSSALVVDQVNTFCTKYCCMAVTVEKDPATTRLPTSAYGPDVEVFWLSFGHNEANLVTKAS